MCQLRHVFTLDNAPTAASVLITADNNYELYINGAAVGYDAGAGGEVWSSVERYDVTTRLARGRNVIGIRGTDLGGIRAVVAAVRVEVKDQPPLEFVTDASWRGGRSGTGGLFPSGVRRDPGVVPGQRRRGDGHGALGSG